MSHNLHVLQVGSEKAPFDRLPNELLSEIFTHCKPHFKTLLNTLRVCRDWRVVAQRTAKMWTDLRLCLDDLLDHPTIVSTWIKRSHPLPISITALLDEDPITGFDHGTQAGEFLPHPGLEEILDAMCAVSERWDTVKVDMPSKQALRLLRAAIAAPSPSSNVLIKVGDTDRLQLKMDHLPNIHGITIRGVSTSLEGSSKPTLSSIRYLNLDALVEVDSFILIISSSPNLETLYLRFSNTQGHMRYRGDPILAPKLHTMNVAFEFTREVHQPSGIFRHFTAPSLTTLRLTDDAFQIIHIKEFLQRSRCPLNHFLYKGGHTILGSISNSFEYLPSLETLEVFTPSDLEKLEIFLTKLGEPHRVPLLRNLTLEMVPWFCDDKIRSPIRDFAERRCPERGGVLQEVNMLWSYTIQHGHPPVDAAFIQGLKEIGINFSLRPTLSYKLGGEAHWE